eukprot:6454734-Amphidinium_carterae.1
MRVVYNHNVSPPPGGPRQHSHSSTGLLRGVSSSCQVQGRLEVSIIDDCGISLHLNAINGEEPLTEPKGEKRER